MYYACNKPQINLLFQDLVYKEVITRNPKKVGFAVYEALILHPQSRFEVAGLGHQPPSA